MLRPSSSYWLIKKEYVCSKWLSGFWQYFFSICDIGQKAFWPMTWTSNPPLFTAFTLPSTGIWAAYASRSMASDGESFACRESPRPAWRNLDVQ